MSNDPQEKSAEGTDVVVRREGAVGRITLNRPKALNALTGGMCAEMLEHLRRWATDAAVSTVVIDAMPGRAFCAGGDIRAIYDAGRKADGSVMRFFETEYRLNAAIHSFPKPYVALIDGYAFGGGCGVSVHGSHRVVSEKAVLAMPETAIGLFPDVGATSFLNRLPGEIGMYLALTGARIDAADAIHSGLATHYVPSADHALLLSRLIGGEAADAALADMSKPPSAGGDLATHRGAIARAFGGASVEEILARLEEEGEWAMESASLLKTRSPTSLKVTHRQMREGATLDFHACQRMEFRIMARMMSGHDFYEGVRAALIDKDQAPRWRPARLEEVSENGIDRFFAPLGEQEFTL